MVPEGTNRALSLPSSWATRRSSSITVGSSPYTSSPTAALAIASRIARPGRVTVSERKSKTGSVLMLEPQAYYRFFAVTRRTRVRSPQPRKSGSVGCDFFLLRVRRVLQHEHGFSDAAEGRAVRVVRGEVRQQLAIDAEGALADAKIGANVVASVVHQLGDGVR